MARYRDGGLMALDTKELYLLNENLCQDIMQIILYARNNDIEIDEHFDRVKAGERASFTPGECRDLIDRLKLTVRISEAVIDHLDKHARNPDGYNEPRITW